MNAPSECLRCKGSMSPGVIMDRAAYNMGMVPHWVAGMPEYSRWSGLKTKGHDAYEAITYRCDRCGYLEAYATEPVDK